MTDRDEAIQALIDWSRHQRKLMTNQIDGFRSGERHIGGADGHKLDDSTQYWITEYKQQISALDKFFSNFDIAS
jgi:hypothetical protein